MLLGIQEFKVSRFSWAGGAQDSSWGEGAQQRGAAQVAQVNPDTSGLSVLPVK